MNSTVLKGMAASWLRYEKQCPLVMFERGLGTDKPDILALTKERLLIEIEIKISLSDFRRDQGKRKWIAKRRGLESHAPAFFYFLVPRDLAEKIRHALPDGAGLLVPLQGWKRNPRIPNPNTGLPDIGSLVAARRHPKAEKLPIRDTIELIRHQSGTLCSMAAQDAVKEMATWPKNT